MNEILSQDEVDALLKGVQSGDISTDAAKEKILSSERPYDLTNQERTIRGRMPGLELANERFVSFFRNSLSSIVMRFISISIQKVEFLKFGEFMKTIPFPSSINIFKMDPLKGSALLVIEAPLLFAFVEFFFGSNCARHVKSEGRSFTSIEQRINKKVVVTALHDMSKAWSGIAPIRPEYVGSEMNPQFVTIVTPGEIIIKIEVLIEVEEFAGKLFFCIPYCIVESVKEKLYSGIQSEKFVVDQRWTARLQEIIIDSLVEVVAEIGSVELTFGELINLEIGSVINLGKPVSDELTIKVEGVPRLYGVAGYRRGNQAIRITRI